jgi:hypothetical protein
MGEFVASMLGLTPEYGNFAVFVFLILMIFTAIISKSEDIYIKRGGMILFSLLLIGAFTLFAIEFFKPTHNKNFEYIGSDKNIYQKRLTPQGNILESTSKKLSLGKDCKARLYLPNQHKSKHKWYTKAYGKWYQNKDGFFVTLEGEGTISFYKQRIDSNHQCDSSY